MYSISKCRRILRSSFKLFQRKRHNLSESTQREGENLLRRLDQAVLLRDQSKATIYAQLTDTFSKRYFPKSLFTYLSEISYALLFAALVAYLIRQFWFELYEVPTGSMRPTINELDRLVVSKTTFGVATPFRKKPFFFSDKYIQRGGMVVFTVEDMDVPDSNMRYFGIFPGKKRYIKRCVAKPGDTIYFYGGRIYAIDKDGYPVLSQAVTSSLKEIGIERIDHIPFINIGGKSSPSKPSSRGIFTANTLRQMNIPIAKLEAKSKGQVDGLFFNGKEWVSDQVNALKHPRSIPMSYSDLWGMGNYAAARLLNKEQLEHFYPEFKTQEGIPLYLELQHTPNLTYPHPEIRQGEYGYLEPSLSPYISLIPLKEKQLEILRSNLYTARFWIQNGRAFRYHEKRGSPQQAAFDPLFPHIPNGCYEFYYGIGYRVYWGGIRLKLSPTHPLYSTQPDLIRKLFNVGMGFNKVFEPNAPYQPYTPQRFAYYRDGDLYVMGAPLFKKEDHTLIQFVHDEAERQTLSTSDKPYIAFIDHGPPLKADGNLNIEFIRAFGLHVPADGIVALGDNYAMSADSREFGFVPTANLRGSPVYTFWPPSSRLGAPPQSFYPWYSFPNLFIWLLAGSILTAVFSYIRRRNRTSIFHTY